MYQSGKERNDERNQESNAANQGQYRIILSADTASEVRQMPSQKRR
jgi:hypothetical protein